MFICGWLCLFDINYAEYLRQYGTADGNVTLPTSKDYGTSLGNTVKTGQAIITAIAGNDDYFGLLAGTVSTMMNNCYDSGINCIAGSDGTALDKLTIDALLQDPVSAAGNDIAGVVEFVGGVAGLGFGKLATGAAKEGVEALWDTATATTKGDGSLSWRDFADRDSGGNGAGDIDSNGGRSENSSGAEGKLGTPKIEKPTDPYDPNWAEYYAQNPDVPRGVGANKTLQANDFEQSIYNLPPGERVAQITVKTKEIADFWGWKKDSKLSRINNRDVYKGNDGNLYAVDSQHGRFEVVNPKNGKHKGEVNIDLEPIPGKQDTSGKHDLKVK